MKSRGCDKFLNQITKIIAGFSLSSLLFQSLDHCCGRGVALLSLISRTRFDSWLEFIQFKTNVRKFKPFSYLGIIWHHYHPKPFSSVNDCLWLQIKYMAVVNIYLICHIFLCLFSLGLLEVIHKEELEVKD